MCHKSREVVSQKYEYSSKGTAAWGAVGWKRQTGEMLKKNSELKTSK